MNLLIPGLAAVSAFVAIPTVIRATMSRIPGPTADTPMHCYGLDGHSSEICCDNPGFADSGCGCDCACHQHEAVDTEIGFSVDHGQRVYGHHHLHWHQHAMGLHSAELPNV